MLLGSTGSRPINDLVESIGQFDFENSYFYVDDKSNSRGNKGRLIALPDKLINFVRSDYLLHLKIISQFFQAMFSGASQCLRDALF